MGLGCQSSQLKNQVMWEVGVRKRGRREETWSQGKPMPRLMEGGWSGSGVALGEVR